MAVIEKNIPLNIGIDQNIQFVDPKTNATDNDVASKIYYTTTKTTVNSKGTAITEIVPLTNWKKWKK